MNINKIIAIFLGLLALTALAWGIFNLLVEQHIYTGSTPMIALLTLPLLAKAYQLYKNSK